ncbi:hypothetical protein KKH39_04925 [Patescibacteria group bacterium]|nr:hypothetical protein [Patescibacteria group bacterium]
MLGIKQKQCLIEGLTRQIREIRIKKITNPVQIEKIILYAMQMRRENIINDFQEIGTTNAELLSWLP